MVKKTGGKTALENMIDNLFSVKIRKEYCKTCEKEMMVESKRSLVALPKTLIVVVDRHTEMGELHNLISSFP